jgi:hypothetical protein
VGAKVRGGMRVKLRVGVWRGFGGGVGSTRGRAVGVGATAFRAFSLVTPPHEGPPPLDPTQPQSLPATPAIKQTYKYHHKNRRITDLLQC